MAFRKKNAAILKYNPDILIVSECENEEKLKFGDLTPAPTDFYWHGDNENKGIGIFSYSNYKLKKIRNFNPQFRYVIPMAITGQNKFNLFAIWAMDNKENSRAGYIAQVWLAINYYKTKLGGDSILIGDFNGNKIWDNDQPRRLGNYSEVHDYLKAKNIHSLYHLQTQEELGKETAPTLFLHRNNNKPYHIDYCYASNAFLVNGFKLSIGEYNDWIKFSDHVPIIADFK
jgi:exonuclease III